MEPVWLSQMIIRPMPNPFPDKRGLFTLNVSVPEY